MELYQQILNLFDSAEEETFNSVALNVFRYQSSHNPFYAEYLKLVHCDISGIKNYRHIPLLPIGFYKSEIIKTGAWQEQAIFKSSGTTASGLRSHHYIKDLQWYDSVAESIFTQAGFTLANTEVLSLLPNYTETGDSSLVHMVNSFKKKSHTAKNSAFLYDHDQLEQRILSILNTTDRSILLFGVTFALLDFAKVSRIDSDRLTIIFTGGMKNRGEELSFAEIVSLLKRSFPQARILSEYGMTELLSQAYSNADGLYTSAPTMRISTRQLQDPFTEVKVGKSGICGIIDLANVDTLSFILTEDMSISQANEEFQILGRMEQSDIRGCNLLYLPN